jgi:hypothetical protein
MSSAADVSQQLRRLDRRRALAQLPKPLKRHLKAAGAKSLSAASNLHTNPVYAWEWTSAVPGGKEGRLAQFQPKDWKKARIVPPIAAWTNALNQQAPMLLAQGAAMNSLMARASLMKSDFLMRTLGRPNRDQIVTERPNELSTLEAIDLANGSLLAQNLEKGAKRLFAAQPPDLVTELYRHALSRNPSEAEKALASEILGPKPTQQGIEDLLWSVCMLPEFQVVR